MARKQFNEKGKIGRNSNVRRNGGGSGGTNNKNGGMKNGQAGQNNGKKVSLLRRRKI